MTPFEKGVDALIREWRGHAAELHAQGKRLAGAERSAAIAHGNTKSADADALRRLCWRHGVGVDPTAENKPGGRR